MLATTGRDAHPQTYAVPVGPTDRVLDALNHVKWHIDGTLTYRRSCAHGIHIAQEGRVHVVGVAPCQRGSDVPEVLRGDLYGGEEDWMSRGFSTIVAAGGDLVAGPVTEREEILYADLDVEAARAQRRQFDPVGHYSRPDVFRLEVDTRLRRPVEFT